MTEGLRETKIEALTPLRRILSHVTKFLTTGYDKHAHANHVAFTYLHVSVQVPVTMDQCYVLAWWSLALFKPNRMLDSTCRG